MTQEPLWASSLATLPEPDEDERLEEPQPPREPDEPEPGPRAAASWLRALPVVLIAAVAGIALALAESGTPFEVKEVDSSWGNTPMRCDTARFETPRTFGGRPRALEVFECRAVRDGFLPDGTYNSPGWTWNSDIDERPAIANRMRIKDGVVYGWARY